MLNLILKMCKKGIWPLRFILNVNSLTTMPSLLFSLLCTLIINSMTNVNESDKRIKDFKSNQIKKRTNLADLFSFLAFFFCKNWP